MQHWSLSLWHHSIIRVPQSIEKCFIFLSSVLTLHFLSLSFNYFSLSLVSSIFLCYILSPLLYSTLYFAESFPFFQKHRIMFELESTTAPSSIQFQNDLDVLPFKMIVDRRFRGAYCLHHQGWVNSAHHTHRRENLKSHMFNVSFFVIIFIISCTTWIKWTQSTEVLFFRPSIRIFKSRMY
jgi:hypothetical protein